MKHKMVIKKNDTVVVITGKDKGKKGKVIAVLPEKQRVVVDGVNKAYRHQKPRQQGEKGERIEFFAPVHVSNVMIQCPKTKKPTRIGIEMTKDGKKQRVCKVSGEVLPN